MLTQCCSKELLLALEAALEAGTVRCHVKKGVAPWEQLVLGQLPNTFKAERSYIARMEILWNTRQGVASAHAECWGSKLATAAELQAA